MNALIFAAIVTLSTAAAFPPGAQVGGRLGYTVVLNGGHEYAAIVDGAQDKAAQLAGPNSGPVNIVGPSVGAISIIGPSFRSDAFAGFAEGPAEVPYKITHGFGW